MNEVVFTSGRRIEANRGIIGINEYLEIAEGYDGPIEAAEADCENPLAALPEGRLTPDECAELAVIMIERWRRFAEARTE
jgi:hypothetical protein